MSEKIIKRGDEMNAYFDRFTIEMTKKQARACSHSGPCDENVKALRTHKKIRFQLARISNEYLKAQLKEYGAWDEEELQDRIDNEERILWIAACDIREEHKL